jgi:hypothetical protein
MRGSLSRSQTESYCWAKRYVTGTSPPMSLPCAGLGVPVRALRQRRPPEFDEAGCHSVFMGLSRGHEVIAMLQLAVGGPQ